MYDMSVTELTETVEGLEKINKEMRLLMSMLDNDVAKTATLTYNQLQDVSYLLNLFTQILKTKMDEVRVIF